MLTTRFHRIMIMVRKHNDGLNKAIEFYHNALGMDIIRITDDWAELSCNTNNTTTTNNNNTTNNTTTNTTTTNNNNNNSNSNSNSSNSSTIVFKLNLQTTTNESFITTGYSPIITFEITNMETTIMKCIELGSYMDGPIQYPAHGKIASIRSPDGHMIGLYEPIQ